MKTKLLILTLLFTMFIPTSVYASQSTTIAEPNAVVSETNTGVSPFFMYSYSKSVEKYYASISKVPDSINYEEYVEPWGWCRGTLYLQTVVKKGSGYNATFTGTMYSPNI